MPKEWFVSCISMQNITEGVFKMQNIREIYASLILMHISSPVYHEMWTQKID